MDILLRIPAVRIRRATFSRLFWGIRLPLFVFILHLSSFIPAASSEDAVSIAHNALLVSPPGEWNLTAVLSTRVSPTKFVQPKTREFPKPAIAPRERHLTIQLKRGSDGSRWMIYRSSNEKGREEGLRVHILKDGAIKFFELAAERPIQDMGAPLFGSAFSHEDISLNFLSWETQKFLGEETVRDRRCWRIASHPPANDPNPHRRVESWIDQQYHGLLQAVAYDSSARASSSAHLSAMAFGAKEEASVDKTADKSTKEDDKDRIIKEFRVQSFQQIEDAWMVRAIEIHAPIIGARGRLEILDAKKVR